MTRNAVKEAARARRRIRGVHMTFAAPAAIEVLVAADIEFVYLDGEHGCFDWRDIETGCLAAERQALPDRARARHFDGDDHAVPRPRRAGHRGAARGIGRGCAARHRKHVLRAARRAQLRRRAAGIWPAYRQQAGLHAGVQCGDLDVPHDRKRGKGLAIAGELAALPGVDYLSFGMLDLAQSLGHPGDSAPPRCQAGGGGGERAHPQGRQAGARGLHEVRLDQRRADGGRAPAPSDPEETAMIESQVSCFDEVRRAAVLRCRVPTRRAQFPAVIIYMDAPGHPRGAARSRAAHREARLLLPAARPLLPARHDALRHSAP